MGGGATALGVDFGAAFFGADFLAVEAAFFGAAFVFADALVLVEDFLVDVDFFVGGIDAPQIVVRV